jgi:hypothetical protein
LTLFQSGEVAAAPYAPSGPTIRYQVLLTCPIAFNTTIAQLEQVADRREDVRKRFRHGLTHETINSLSKRRQSKHLTDQTQGRETFPSRVSPRQPQHDRDKRTMKVLKTGQQ